MNKILMVCLGNICRSPMAEALFRERVKGMGKGSEFFFDSAGTSANHVGEQPDLRTLKVCAKNTVPIQHHGRQITLKDLESFDQILVMDQSNERNVRSLTQNSEIQKKILNITHFHHSYPEISAIPDPYYDGEEMFQEVFQLLDNCFNGWIKRNS